MCEQTRQQIAAELEYAIGQLRGIDMAAEWIGGTLDRRDRTLDALERIQSYMERADPPHHPSLAERLGEARPPAGWDHV